MGERRRRGALAHPRNAAPLAPGTPAGASRTNVTARPGTPVASDSLRVGTPPPDVPLRVHEGTHQ